MIVASQQDNKSNQTFGASPLSAWHPFETWHCEHFFFIYAKSVRRFDSLPYLWKRFCLILVFRIEEHQEETMCCSS